MQTLVELTHLQYESIALYFPKIALVTYRATNNDDPMVGIQGIEFWTNLTEQEIERDKKGLSSKNYI